MLTINDVIQNINSNKELWKSFEDETKSQQSKIKLLQQEIQTLKSENKDLKEENKSHLKIIELLSTGHDSDNPLRNQRNYNPAQTCITNQDNSISSNLSTWNFRKTVSRQRPTDPRPNTLTPAVSQNRFAPLSIELENTWKSNNSDNQSNYDHGTKNYIKRQSNHILQRSNANAINAKKRPDICITEKYIKNFTPTTDPGTSTYSGITKHGRKIWVVGDSHIKRIKRNDCNKELRHGKAFFRSFSGANTKQLRHYIIPTLVDDKSDAIVIHVGKNDILNHANHENIAHSIINIGLDCKTNGVDEVLISSILVKKNPNLTAIVRRVNDMLRDLCKKNGFSFICNDVITTNYLWKDGVHMQDMGTHIFSNHFLKFLNYSIDSNFHNRLRLNDSPQTNDVSSDIKGLIDLRKHFPYNPLIGYININSLKEKLYP